MTQPTNKQVTPLIEFVDSVFAELSSHDNKWNPHEEGYGYYDNPDCWKDTLIPLGIRLYELAQADDKVYWWLLQMLSQVDLCKDSKDDLGKSDVFTVLSTLKRKYQKIVLEKCVPAYADGLLKALDDNSLNAFMSVLPTTDENVTICTVSKVLKRAMGVRAIYDDAMSHTEGDSLGRLFVLFRQYYYYFTDAYKENQRSCDGMAKNIFLALYQTQYREDKLSFCRVADSIGDLWVRSLMLAYFQYREHLPQSVKELLLDVLQGQNADDFGQMEHDLKNKLTDEKIESFVSDEGGWLEIEKYSFIYKVLKDERNETTPPFSCLCTNKKKKRKRISGNAEHRDNLDKIHYKDNYVPYLKSKNAVPLEELKAAMVDNPSVAIILPLIDEEGADSGLAKQNPENDIETGSPRVEVASENNPNKAEETLNQKARRLIGELLQKIPSQYRGCTMKELDKFFDAVLIDKRKDINESELQEKIVKELFFNRSKYEYYGLKVNVFCKILGFLLSPQVGWLIGEPQSIAEVLQPCLTEGKNDPESTENLRTYIQKAKKGILPPPGERFMKKVLGIKTDK